ncbi:hypothetical protein [Alteriqipengyuania sp. 357]
MTTEIQQKPLWRRLVLPLLGGAVVGGLGAAGFMELAELGRSDGLGTSREIAGLVGMLYALTGLMVLIGAINPGFGAKFLNVEDADELREMRPNLRLSGIAMILLGATLMLLAVAGSVAFVPAGVAAILAVAMIAVASVLSIRSKRYTDELQRALSADAMATAFYLVFFVGGGWALFAHLGFLVPAEPLDWLTMFAVALMIAAFWQTARRGLLNRGPN